jgi:hypothetical protein
MKNFAELKKQVESMNAKVSPLSKTQREIRFYEQDLKLNGVQFEFSMLLSELDPDRSEETFGPHNYTRTHYRLNWQRKDPSYIFTVTNIKANKTFPLIDCPEHLQTLVLPMLTAFIQEMANNFKDTLEYDEDYAEEEDS